MRLLPETKKAKVCPQLGEVSNFQKIPKNNESTTLLFRTNVEDLPFLEKWS